ncbi:4-hydroxy-tetrahydrodipicolinate synthase [Alkalihalobacillus sp. MEB130]|uniref:4-hydroxy-tetrahydrodipicolinate synthase n=1 Tax=Alkalihalobacillus sp. MEB130 TaxID=2976704 RepID=UPI0028DD5B28|nr:4-hydroxy-tetrahydrodipicolinate synthase [Alkalihalobacillus sp. MEB130]MDT8858909.1 4-hydroxy-tetrahydrodipicolinate synthase [Alkalihalobacillus sp. MEB130]
MFKPEGVVPALVTPFDEKGEINEGVLRQLVRRTIDNGCHGIFALGSNGEFFALSYEEKVKIANICVDEAKGQVPVYVGTGCNSTKETIELTKEMEQLGVSAVSVITPYFVKLSQSELIAHYEALSEATNVPIILYNIPGLTQNALAPETVAHLSKRSNIVAIKDSSGNFDNILQYIELADPDFSVMAGTDSLILATLMAGGKGGVAATANFLPKAVVSIYEKWKAGDIEGAEQEQRKLRAIRNAFKLGSLPSVLKESLNEIGLNVGNPRLPVSPLSGQTKAQVQTIVKGYIEAGEFELLETK